jgi:hypothetical protein
MYISIITVMAVAIITITLVPTNVNESGLTRCNPASAGDACDA